MIMKIEAIIKDAFEKDMEQYRGGIPLFSGDVPVLPGVTTVVNGKKRGKERYGSLIVTTIMVLLVSVFSLRTGMFESSLVVPWADIVKLIPENPAEAFLDSLRRVHTPAPWGGIKGMYPESNTLEEQPYPVRSAARLVDFLQAINSSV
jgi:hypothetical protein